MHKLEPYRLGHSLIAAATVVLSIGCAEDTPLALEGRAAPAAQLAAPSAATRAGTLESGMAARAERRAVDLGTCDSLAVQRASVLAFHAFAAGVQIYHWNGTSWVFDAPSAVLSADAEHRSTVGTHYAGPTWESVSGSRVRGTVLKRCTPKAQAIPWLLLQAISPQGPGIFDNLTFIQRVNTWGGNAPSSTGSFTGEQASVPYTAEYLFYRAR